MVLSYDNEKLLIGKIKSLTQDTDTKNLFDAYVPEASFERNVELLGRSTSIKLPTLKIAAELLGSLAAQYPAPALEISASKANKKDLFATDIIRFIHRCRDITCLKCSTDYPPWASTNTESIVNCHFCHTPSHSGCYSDSELDSEAGVVYLCPACLGSKIPPVHVTPPPVQEPSAPHIEATKDTTISGVTESVVAESIDNGVDTGNDGRRSDHDSRSKKPSYDRSKAVCPLLLEGNCSHGISGKNCTGYHPPWCHKFQYNGKGGKRGCHIADDKCKFFHPQLCQNAVSTGVCLNKPCKKVHIRGTITTERDLKDSRRGRHLSASLQQNQHPPNSRPEGRTRPQDRDNRGSRPSRNRMDSSSSSSNPSDPHRTRAVSFSESHVHHSNEDFLKHLSSMKADLSKEITSMVQSSLQNLLASSQLFQQVQQQPSPQMYHHSQLPQFQQAPQPHYHQVPQTQFLQPSHR